MYIYDSILFVGDPMKQEAPQEETAFVRLFGHLAVCADPSWKAYNLASLSPITLKFWTQYPGPIIQLLQVLKN